ncbi:glutamine amidotransferase [Virgisporangium aliadipatigenens]|uniref:Glutamine amidotransferase n=1 Tax=Virgisporangium aliadipatigenens TaxID=741659 RepID=A0A8J3YIL1_9ACTN|nr:DJ-1/PfpI family protein [Virgisporangium aliadipatigenens]GIJ46004.1 glutamine amidotransferase [Virgisporangium aliadipatigenens]
MHTENIDRRTILRATAAAGVALPAAAPTTAAGSAGPRIALLLFDGITAMDAIGPYEVLSRIPGASVLTVGKRRGAVRTETGAITLGVARALREVDRADVLLVPGGGVADVQADPETIHWIQRLHRHTTWTVAVCTGALILGTAGLLRGLPATTYWALTDRLASFGATYVPRRFVEAGKIMTSAGVSAGIDLALHLTARLTDERTARAAQLVVEYDPDPPFDSGSPDKAGPDLRRYALELLQGSIRP